MIVRLRLLPIISIIALFLVCPCAGLAAQDGGYNVTSSLWAKAVLEVPGSPVTLVWQLVGSDITPSGDQVISGYFYADPDSFAYGSRYNPELFVKIYIAKNGWCNIAFNHVTVDPVSVYSAHHNAGSPSQTGLATLTNRLVEHQYDGVAIDTTLQSTGGSSGTGSDAGYAMTSDLWARAMLQPVTGPVNLIWKMVGADTTPSGDSVVSGYFYASPDDFAYGSVYNPEVFVKIYIAASGWANIAFNHVTVADIDISSAHQYGGLADQSATATLNGRLVEHQYDGVSASTSFLSIELGEPTTCETVTVGTNGLEMAVNKPGTPIDGMVITIPPGAYQEETGFTVSYSPIISHSGNENFNPVTPLISIENGGDYSEEFMVVTIPVQIPVGYFAAPFFFDAEKGKLEPMQLVSSEDNSVTVITRHFSSFLVTGMAQSVLDAYLEKGIRSDFSPGVDDFSFTNRGSYISPGGHCAGQAMGVMWYYTAKPEGNLPLWGSYDNNFGDRSTPDFWRDDSYAYRFCSVLQEDIDWDNFATDFWLEAQGRVWKLVNNKWERVEVPAIGPEGTRNMFALAMLLTGEPQYVSIKSDAGGGHAMIVYAVTQDALHIADPNYPGHDDRLIWFINGAFNPYSSGDNWEDIQAGRGKNYETILYLAKSTLMPGENIARRWQEVQDGTIGNDWFPSYEIQYPDEDTGIFHVLGENQVFTENKVRLSLSGQSGRTWAWSVYRDQAVLTRDSDYKYELVPGNNLLGFYVVAEVGGKFKYVDFQYVNVIHEPEETDPNSHTFVSENGNIEIVYQMNGAILGTPIDGSSATSVSESRKHDGQSTGSGILHISGHIKFTAYQLRNESYHDRLDDHTISVWVRDPGFSREDRQNFSFPADQSVNHPFSVSIPMMDSGWHPGANYSISVRRGAADLHSSHGEGSFEYLKVTGSITGYKP